MSISTAVSRVTGFARTWAMGVAMGVTIVTSSYVVANNIPNMIFELVAGGVLSAMFIPLFLERKQEGGEDDAWRFASSVFNLAMIALGIVALLGTVFAEPVVRTQTFRITAEKAQLATYFFRFFAVQIVFYGAAILFTGVLNAERRFLAPAIAPIFNNVVVIVTLLGFYMPYRDSNPRLAATGLAIGTTLGVVSMAVVQLPSLLKMGTRYRAVLDFKHPAMRKMGRKMLPVIGYVAVNMVGISFRNAYAFAASTEQGPAALQYAWMWYQLPYGIFAVALATAIFPELADAAAASDWDGFRKHFSVGLRATGIIILPMSAMLIALAGPLIRLYQFGRFEASDVPIVAGVLVVWGAGLFSYAAFMFALRSMYALQDSKTPMITNVFVHALQIGLYAVLTVGIAGWGGIGIAGIPLSDAIAYSLHFVVLVVILRMRVGNLQIGRALSSLGRVAVASVLGGLSAFWVLQLTATLQGATLGFLLQLMLAGAVGLAVCYGLAFLMRVPEMSFLARLVRKVTGRGEPPHHVPGEVDE